MRPLASGEVGRRPSCLDVHLRSPLTRFPLLVPFMPTESALVPVLEGGRPSLLGGHLLCGSAAGCVGLSAPRVLLPGAGLVACGGDGESGSDSRHFSRVWVWSMGRGV